MCSNVEKVDDEEDDIDDDNDKVQSGAVANAALTEARPAAVPKQNHCGNPKLAWSANDYDKTREKVFLPASTEKRADNESDDHLHDLDHAAVCLQVASVQRNFSHFE